MKKNAAGKQKETGIRTQKQAYLFLAPSLIILTVFVFVPLVGAIAISLMNINIYMNDISFAGLKNYLKMFTDARVGNATLNTFYFALLEVTVWKGFGNTLTVLSAAALGVSHSLYEAAELDGAGGFQQFLYVTIPGIRDTIGFCTVTTLIMALQVFDQIYVMTEGGPQYKTETLVGYIYNKGFQMAPFDLGYASSMAVYLFLIIAVLTFIMRKYAFPQGGDEE